MNPALALMGIYIIVTGLLQFVGFLVSRVAEVFDPTLSLITFLALYLGMFWVGWPIAVRITETYVPGAKASS